MMNEKMIATVTEIVQSGAELWDVFDICDKHELDSVEESLVISMYEQSRNQMLQLLEREKVDELEESEAIRTTESSKNIVSVSLNDVTSNGFGT